MHHESLMALVEQYEVVNNALDAQRRRVWNAIEAVEPGLVEELLQFFSTSDAASLWLLKASGANQPCPAKAIAEVVARKCLSDCCEHSTGVPPRWAKS